MFGFLMTRAERADKLARKTEVRKPKGREKLSPIAKRFARKQRIARRNLLGDVLTRRNSIAAQKLRAIQARTEEEERIDAIVEARRARKGTA